jgi:hypothetical protein
MKKATSPAEAPERSPAIEACVEEEVLEWYRMSPQERWAESMRLWDTFYLLGGTLEPEPDSQSPFHDALARGRGSPDGRPGLRAVRRGGV